MNIENIEKHQFQPGESGNPAGRPKGSRNLSTILREFLEQEVDEFVNGTKERSTYGELIIRKLIKKAYGGNIRAIQEIFDRMEGKARQEMSINTDLRKATADLFPEELTGGDQSKAFESQLHS